MFKFFDRESGLAAGLGMLVLCVGVLGAALFAYSSLNKPPSQLLAEGRLDEFKAMIQQYPGLARKKHKTQGSLLMQAVRARSMEAVKCLIMAGADIQQVDRAGHTVLSYVLDDADMMLQLLELGADPDHVEQDGSTLMHLAVQAGNPFSVYALAMAGAPINTRDAQNRTPLHLAHGELVDYLLEQGANPNLRDQVGATALHVAVERNDCTAVRALVKGRANLSAISWQGWSPLHLSAIYESVDVMCLLLEAGVRIDIENERGVTPLDCAIRQNNLDSIRALVGFGASLKRQDGFGNTPLHSALNQGKYEACRLLVSLGAPLDIENEACVTPRQMVLETENTDLISTIAQAVPAGTQTLTAK